MSSSGERLMPAASVVGLLLTLTAVAGVWSSQAHEVCVSGKKVTLSLNYSTNATRHSKVMAHVEQPTETPGWQLDIEFGTSECGPAGAPRKTLTLIFNDVSPPPPPGYVSLPGLGLYRSPAQALSWQEARDLCAQEGATLWVPSSQREVEALVSRFPFNATGAQNSDEMWIGVNDIAQEGKFVTVKGEPLENTGYSKFHHSYPSGKTSRNCLVVMKPTKLLADDLCSWKFTFICKLSQ